MSRPRIVRRGAFVLITRSIVRREFWLTPDPETVNDLGYLAARAAQLSGTVVVAMVIEANHHHTILWDPLGLHPRFTEYFHGMVARVWKRRFGVDENLWTAEQVDVVRLTTRAALVEKLVYVFGNPVKDNLVDRALAWPGLTTYATFLGAPAPRFRRPRHYFGRHSPLPAELALEAGLPGDVPDADALVREVDAGVEALERAMDAARRARGGRVLGARRILAQRRQACPRAPRPRRARRGRYAGDARACHAAYQQERVFLSLRRAAWELRRDGVIVPFPDGTYRANLPIARLLLLLARPPRAATDAHPAG